MTQPKRHVTNYRRGADAERRAIKELLCPRPDSPELFKMGWGYAMRSAGSHGLWDINAMCSHTVLYAQIKRAHDLATARRLVTREARKLKRHAMPPNVLAAVLVRAPRRWLGAVRSQTSPLTFF